MFLQVAFSTIHTAAALKLAFEISHSKRKLIFCAFTESEKMMWMKDIKACIAKFKRLQVESMRRGIGAVIIRCTEQLCLVESTFSYLTPSGETVPIVVRVEGPPLTAEEIADITKRLRLLSHPQS